MDATVLRYVNNVIIHAILKEVDASNESLPTIYLPLHLSGLAYGITLGYRESIFDATLRGSTGLIMGLNVIVFVPIVYLKIYLNAQTDTYKALNFQGIPNAFAFMMLIWTIFVTMLHENEETALTNAVIQTAVKVINGESDAVIEEESAPITEESEF